MFYELVPEVAGHLGPETLIDRSQHPPIVRAVHYEFDGSPVDDLIEAFPCFIVTDKMRKLIESARASGCSFGPVKVTTSEEFAELEELESQRQSRTLPPFSWLLVHGTARQDDFGVSATGMLTVSERILRVLKRGSLENCDIAAA